MACQTLSQLELSQERRRWVDGEESREDRAKANYIREMSSALESRLIKYPACQRCFSLGAKVNAFINSNVQCPRQLKKDLRTLNNWRNQASHARGTVGTSTYGSFLSKSYTDLNVFFTRLRESLEALQKWDPSRPRDENASVVVTVVVEPSSKDAPMQALSNVPKDEFEELDAFICDPEVQASCDAAEKDWRKRTYKNRQEQKYRKRPPLLNHSSLTSLATPPSKPVLRVSTPSAHLCHGAVTASTEKCTRHDEFEGLDAFLSDPEVQASCDAAEKAWRGSMRKKLKEVQSISSRKRLPPATPPSKPVLRVSTPPSDPPLRTVLGCTSPALFSSELLDCVAENTGDSFRDDNNSVTEIPKQRRLRRIQSPCQTIYQQQCRQQLQYCSPY